MTRTTVLLATLLAACTAKNPERERPVVAAAEPAKQDPPPAPDKPVDPPKPGPTKQDPPKPELPPPPVEPVPAASTSSAGATAEPGSTGGADDTGGTTGPAGVSTPLGLVATAITAIDHTPTWREVASLPADAAPNGFYPFATGILTGKQSAFYSTDAAGGLVAAPGVEAPPGAVSGHWPGEAWSIHYKDMNDRAVTTRVRVLRLRGGNRWVPQFVGDDQWQYTEDVGAARKSWKIGYLVDFKHTLLRLASNGLPDPTDLVYHGDLLDVVESKDGDLFTHSTRGGIYFVQVACHDQACADTSATPLPPGAWEWLSSIPRQKHSISLTLREAATDRRTHLLHYETGGWKLEALADGERLVALWPTADGGLWAQTEGALYHRDPAGGWRKAALPADVQPTGPVFAAMTGDMSELWLIGARSGAQVVLATKAKAQDPA